MCIRDRRNAYHVLGLTEMIDIAVTANSQNLRLALYGTNNGISAAFLFRLIQDVLNQCAKFLFIFLYHAMSYVWTGVFVYCYTPLFEKILYNLLCPGDVYKRQVMV